MRYNGAVTFLAALLLALPLAAQEEDVFKEISVHAGKFALVGWNKACSVAVSNLGYPKLGEAIVGDPIKTRIGTLTIAPGKDKAKAAWKANWDGRGSWRPDYAESALKELATAGYALPGIQEVLVPERYEGDPELRRVLLSTAAFKTSAAAGIPKSAASLKLAYVLYSPLTSGCGLLVFSKGGTRGPFEPVLARVYNAGARHERARAHLKAADLLYGNGDARGALEETAAAAALAPESPAARYGHAAMLGRFGYRAQALPELEASLALDPALKDKARKDEDFDSLRDEPRFKTLVAR